MTLRPHYEDFFALFADQARLVSAMSGLLVDEATGGNAIRQDTARRIAELEHDGDETVRKLALSLNRSYQTPFDPKDIRALCSRLDDVLDGIEDVAYRMAAYHFDRMPGPAIELCGIIDACSKALEAAVGEIAKRHAPFRQCGEIDRLESEGDTIVRMGAASLLGSNADPIMVIKLKELYELLEDTVDRCRHAADTIRNVVAKTELK
jgi:uncharacterized protein Yka (UPF0111/DUF47 family)